VTGRWIERDKVDDANWDIATNVGGKRSSYRDLHGVGDFEVTTTRDAESVGLL